MLQLKPFMGFEVVTLKQSDVSVKRVFDTCIIKCNQ